MTVPRSHQQVDFTGLLQFQPSAQGLEAHGHQGNLRGVIFGGQLLCQSLAVAAQHTATDLQAHSLQVQFLHAGNVAAPLHYQAETLRQGRSIHAVTVHARQQGRLVTSASVSFQQPDQGPSHAAAMPVVPQPDALPSLPEVLACHAARVRPDALDSMSATHELDIRLIDAGHFLFERDAQARMRYWVRMRRHPGDAPWAQQAALAYLSDYLFPLVGLAPHLEHKLDNGLFMATLNHSIWYHHPIQAQEWMLVDAWSPFGAQSRALYTCHVYTEQGTLLATVVQEGLWRGWQRDAQGKWRVPPLPPAS